jgi:FlgD Ig-like domain/FG-GAP repeat/FG-GAP-like repeat
MTARLRHQLGACGAALVAFVALESRIDRQPREGDSHFDARESRARSTAEDAARTRAMGGAPARFPAPCPEPDASTRAAGADAGWWQSVTTGLERQEYHATVGAQGLQAPNRAQNLRTVFGPRGIEIEPRVKSDTAPAWRFAWKTTGLGRDRQIARPRRAVVEHDGARVTYRRPGWSEWYQNTEEGLEQGFTVDRQPPGQDPLRITGSFEAGLTAEFRDGAIDFLDRHGARVLRYGKLVAYDATGRTLPSKLALEERIVSIEIDDRDAAYPLTIDPLMTSPAWTADGNQAGAAFGNSVSTAGDVNGDGYSDVVVGAYAYDGGQGNSGRAFLFYGSPSGLSVSPFWIGLNDQNSRYGQSVSAAGDVNGDGFGDIIIGAMWYGALRGRAFVYHGSAAGLGTAAAWVADGSQDGALFGYSVSTAGDVNGDGFSDVIVGAPYYDNGLSDEGRSYVYHGSASGLAASPAWTGEENQVGAAYGISAATAGDVNGDGYSDVVVGAYANPGRAFVYLGSPGGLAPAASWVADGNQTGALFGVSVATAGDVNGDGFADVIIGSSNYGPESSEGRALVYHGSAAGLAASPGWIVEGNQQSAQFGISVSTAGDVDGDGYADVIVGAETYSNGEQGEGRAFVYLGSSAGLNTAPYWVAEPNQAFAGFEYFSVATAGDVNGDGFSDVIFGASGYDNGETDEGRVFAYYGGPNGLAPFASWFMNGGQTNAGFGYSVATAGDVNGDGYSDVIAVADRYDNGQADEGKAWVYHGTMSGLASVPAWSAETNQLAAMMSSAACAGDVNGDGYSDVILGSYGYDNGESNEGRTWLYLGSTFGLNGSPVWTSEPNQAGAEFGWSVASAGDVNGDGYSDVIVGADAWDNGQNNEGRALLYMGSAAGLGSPTWGVEGNQDGAYLGYSVATAGDVNGDGLSDVLVALPTYDNGEPDEGLVWVFHGSAAGPGASPSRVLEANQAGASFGFDVASAGDVNGDRFSDVIVGAQSYDGGQTDEGRAFVYHGGVGGLSTTPVWTTEPDQASAQLGRSVATAGDVNGDGYSDVIVGAPYYDLGATNDGVVWVYHGSPTGLGGPAWYSYGGQPNAFYGLAVGTAGDVNGDGFSDVVTGAYGFDWSFTDEGGAWVFLGNEGDGLDRVRGQLRTDGTAPIHHLGVSDSESEVLLSALARTPAGRGKVRLEVEMKPAGLPFNGTGLVRSAYGFTGAPAVGGSSVSILQDVSGLVSGTLYRWRVRIASDSPFFPRSPWLWLPYNGATEGDIRTAGPSSTGIASAAPPSAHWLGQATPNPFTTSTTLTYALPERSTVRLAVFDVQGRLVAKLADGAQDAGQHNVHWDGRDDRGHLMPAGVYFARFESGRRIESQKILVVR